MPPSIRLERRDAFRDCEGLLASRIRGVSRSRTLTWNAGAFLGLTYIKPWIRCSPCSSRIPRQIRTSTGIKFSCSGPISRWLLVPCIEGYTWLDSHGVLPVTSRILVSAPAPRVPTCGNSAAVEADALESIDNGSRWMKGREPCEDR